MPCICGGPVEWEDDDEFEICDHCYEQQLVETARFEPVDDPQPRELLPDPESSTIDSRPVNISNVKRLVGNFIGVVDAVRASPRDGEVTEADLLRAIENMIRLYAAQMIGERIPRNPTAAVTNAITITNSLQTLIDEIRALDLPNPVVN